MEKKYKKLKPVHGIILFLFSMISFYTVIYWLQSRFGMYGLAMTELYLLAASFGITILAKADLREVFPIKKPEIRKILGTLLLWAGSYVVVTALTMLLAWGFPKQMFEMGSALNETLSSVPFLVSVIISAVLPAVCEEAMHRGVILHSFRKIRKDWILVLLMGILFGVFHGSIWRFVPTALLGAALTWLMLKTENMLYPALFHFINNFLPSFMSRGASVEETAASTELLIENGLPLAAVGVYVMLSAAAPFAIYTAAYLLQSRKEEKRSYWGEGKKGRRMALLICLTVLPLILGQLLLVGGILMYF